MAMLNKQSLEEIFESNKMAFFDTKEVSLCAKIPKEEGFEYDCIPGTKAILRNDNNAFLGISSERYKPLNNKDVVERMTKILDETNIDYKLSKIHSILQGKKTKFEFSFPTKKISPDTDLKVGDVVEIRCFLNNSFDAKSSVKLEFGFFRLACLNGAMVGSKDFNISIPHFKNVDKNVVNMFVSHMETKFSEIKDYIEFLNTKSFKKLENVQQFIMDDKNEILPHKRYAEQVLEKWEKDYSKSKSLWGVYNTYTDVITHVVKSNIYNKMNKHRRLSETFRNLPEDEEYGKLIVNS